MYTNLQFILRNNLGYPCSAGTSERKLGRWFARKNEGQLCFVLRKAFCLAYVQVFNIHHLLWVGIAFNSACKLNLAQKLAGGLLRGFKLWVWQLKMCTVFLLFFFSFIHFIFRQVPGNFLRSSLLLGHAATDVISRDDKVEPLQTKEPKLLVRCPLGEVLALGTVCPASLKDLRPVWFGAMPTSLCQPLEREWGLADVISTLRCGLLLALEARLSP